MRHNQISFLSFMVLVQFSLMLSLDDNPTLNNTVYHNTVYLSPHNPPIQNIASRLDTMMQASLQAPLADHSMSKQQYREVVAYIQAQDYHCRQHFRMGLNEFNHTMWLGYDDFIDKVFNRLRLSDNAIRQLWQIYLYHSIFKRKSKVQKYTQVIEDKIVQRNQSENARQLAKQEAIDRQNKALAIEQEAAQIKSKEQQLFAEQIAHEKQAQQEEQKKLEQVKLEQAALEQETQTQQEALIFYEQMVKSQYQACDFDLANCSERELEKQWCERQEALSITVEQDFKQFNQAFYLDAQTTGFLAAHDIDYNDFHNFFGTALQQQLHGEMCDVLSQAAIVQKQFGEYQRCLLTSVVEFADAAYETNKNEQVLLASQLMDVDWIVLKLSREIAVAALPYAQAVASGVAHSAIDFIKMAADPIATCQGLGKALYYVAETIALNSYDEIEGFEDIYEPLREQRNAEILQALHSLGNQMANSTGPQRVEALTRFGADFIVPGKILHAVGGICGAIRSQAKIMRTLEGITPVLGDELGFEEIAQEIIQATEKLEVATQENIGQSVATELMEAPARIVKKNPINPELIVDAQLIEERIVQAKQHFSGVIQKSLEEIKMLSQKYGKITLEFEGMIQDIAIDVEHIFLPEIKPSMGYSKFSNNQMLKDIRLTGWHYGYLVEFEKSGLVQILKTVAKDNCTYIEMVWPYGKEVIPKTLFPDFWSRQKVIEKILEAMGNIIETKERNGRFIKLGKTITGKTIEGVEIEIKLTRDALQDPWKIATAFVKRSYITGV